MIFAGGATPVEQKRHAQLIDDAINATRAAAQDGIIAGGGVALLQIAPQLDDLIENLSGSERIGAMMLRSALEEPLKAIAANAGRDAAAVAARVQSADRGYGTDARTGKFGDMLAAGIIDPVAVAIAALRNAASVAALILTTQTLIAKKPDYSDPTVGPALGGGAEKIGRA
jgi:chaperonin GroEL